MDRNARDSGIELLKILAIFLIVISHVAQTLTSENPYITYNGYIVDISHATTNIQHLILVCFRTFGPLGNSIFFVCSTWFLNIPVRWVLPQLSVSSCFWISQFRLKQPLTAPSIHCSLYHF